MLSSTFLPIDKTVWNKDFRNYYKRRTADNMEGRLHEYVNDRILKLFIKKVADRLVNYRAGVNIKRIGYFFIFRRPFDFYRRETKRFKHLKKYMPAFIPTTRSIFRYYSIDHEFHHKIYKRLNERVNQGYRYLNMIKGVGNKRYIYQGLRTLRPLFKNPRKTS